MKLTLGFSPCPNDTFVFDALVNHKIDTEGLEFEVVLADVQTLNEWALQGKLDFSKISYGVLPLIRQQYTVLNSGGALGKGVGPLLITADKNNLINFQERFTNADSQPLIAIPGENTTAHMLFSLAFPNARKKVFKVFHEIEDAVLSGEVDAGVIIHENRFTYHTRGLHKIMDLGEYWEATVKAPIPLGGIVARKNLDQALITRVNSLIQISLQYSYDHHHHELSDYVKAHAQEMSETVMRQHINLYVNDFSRQLGTEGEKAVTALLQVYQQLHPGTAVNTAAIFS
ncbi:1,4-dihydroxy-6-naphthoate synthase [Filimonas zeae]|uniref:1,4-dihydroxy-6-naphtoate synthase n=1 Tax=Filimonas zeae TaxID=1737353 RepID=A0A917MYH7_9BACT|nr:1,4-dihydroxy-6-naphthoate synthase [Filimonas zeae]MDR6342154.1 1,4-dihydroxy-6-naphthoate synthase [Filimonas zeae]GGH78896.1 1,4-dihydroxy-6-naphtoate synthase [Filimonas zeae]